MTDTSRFYDDLTAKIFTLQGELAEAQARLKAKDDIHRAELDNLAMALGRATYALTECSVKVALYRKHWPGSPPVFDTAYHQPIDIGGPPIVPPARPARRVDDDGDPV